MALMPHVWTIGTQIQRALSPLRAPESVAWETVLEDPQVGPVRLGGRLREHPGDELIILVHGLGGSASSKYMLQGAVAADAEGLSCLRINLRGADRRGEDYYHAALTADLHAALASEAVARFKKIYVLGYSLGGHLTLRLATEPLDPRVVSVAAVCSPPDLALAEAEIDGPGAGVYRWYLLRSLGSIYRAVAARRPVPFPVERLDEIHLIREWDDLIVAPRHGFADAADYYARASVAPRLPDLRVPALLLNTESDPMVPAAAVKPVLEQISAPLLEVVWVRGGHVAVPSDLDAGLGEVAGLEGQVIGWLRTRE